MNVLQLDYGFANGERITTVAPETYRVLENGLPAITDAGPLYNVDGKPCIKKNMASFSHSQLLICPTTGKPSLSS